MAIKPEKINWDKVHGLDLGLFLFSNDGNAIIRWNTDRNVIEAIQDGIVLVSWRKSQVYGVMYKKEVT